MSWRDRHRVGEGDLDREQRRRAGGQKRKRRLQKSPALHRREL